MNTSMNPHSQQNMMTHEVIVIQASMHQQSQEQHITSLTTIGPQQNILHTPIDSVDNVLNVNAILKSEKQQITLTNLEPQSQLLHDTLNGTDDISILVNKVESSKQEKLTNLEPAQPPLLPPIENVQNVVNVPIPVKTKKEKPEKPKNMKKKKKEAVEGQAREVIYRMIKFFESEKQSRGYAYPVENVVKRACAATGLSESTIKRIKRDGLAAEATESKIPGPKKKRVRRTKVQLDYFQLCALRGIVNSYSVRKEVPTLGKILEAAKNELNYQGGKESLRLILLNKLGIKFKKSDKKLKKPIEEPQQIPNQVMQQQMPTIMPTSSYPQMQQMKPMDNQCVYTNCMMQQVPPVSY